MTWFGMRGLDAGLRELTEVPPSWGVTSDSASRTLAVAAEPAHPSNRVDVEIREEGRPAAIVRAARSFGYDGRLPGVAYGCQLFRTVLPSTGGAPIDYRFVLSRAGQQVATLPMDGSWLTTGGQPAAEASRPAGGEPQGAPPDAPRWAYDLTFFAALTVDLRAEVLGATPEGYRINFYVKDGTVRGPSIDARVLPEGGDWMCIRPDGIGMVDISITYQTADGALILERAGGVFDLGPDGYSDVSAGRFRGSPPFYATPSWETAHPDWQWINRRQGFGIGRVVLEQLQVRCDIYIPTVGEPLAGAR